MAELACVYDAAPVPRTPEDVISTPAQKRRKKKAQAGKPKGRGKPREPQARGKWLTASVTDDIPAVIAAAFDEAERRDPGHKREWVVLIDGNNTQIEAVTAEAARRGITVTIVIDFIHVAGILWKAAWSFFDKGEPAAEEWVADQARKILHGKSAQVAAGIRRRATTYGYSPAERAGADECARYLDNKKAYLDYATALAKGWPIATGIIEGACRHIVKDRMDITGARWGLEGAEAILKLRALIANGDFEDYWRFHLRREHERIHHARYRDRPHPRSVTSSPQKSRTQPVQRVYRRRGPHNAYFVAVNLRTRTFPALTSPVQDLGPEGTAHATLRNANLNGCSSCRGSD